MFRKSVIVALGFLGLFLAGTAAGTAPASAHYACGPWNGWCGRVYWLYPGWGYGWYGYNYRNWGRSYGYRDRDWHQGDHGYRGDTHWRHYD